MSRVQKTANKIQQGDHPAWWQNIQDWVEELQFAYEKDIVSLEDWISERS
jgi:two-component system aerobic respiration control sensor histidine kinase ArcB